MSQYEAMTYLLVIVSLTLAFCILGVWWAGVLGYRLGWGVWGIPSHYSFRGGDGGGDEDDD